MLSYFQDPSNRDRTVHQGSVENRSARKITGKRKGSSRNSAKSYEMYCAHSGRGSVQPKVNQSEGGTICRRK